MACKLIVCPRRMLSEINTTKFDSPARCMMVVGLDDLLCKRVPEQYGKYQDECRSGNYDSHTIIFSTEELIKIRNLFMSVGASWFSKDYHKFSILYTFGENSVIKILFYGWTKREIRWSIRGHVYDKRENIIERIQNTKPQFTLKL